MTLSKLTHRLKTRRKAILSLYDEEDLHQLRVAIRRLRALLKTEPGKSAKRLRKSWRKLARHTNAARDWDTFVFFARKALDAENFHPLQLLLEHRQNQARRRVLKALQSQKWSANMKAWKAYIKQPGLALSEESAGAADIEAVSQRVESASRHALARSTAARWHALRIAIKELRYTLDTLRPTAPVERQQIHARIALCKRLQTDLGDWHDSVVHLGLLQQLAADAGPNADPVVRRALDSLDSILRVRGNAGLERVRATLAAEAVTQRPVHNPQIAG